jgi:hypothetical protein
MFSLKLFTKKSKTNLRETKTTLGQKPAQQPQAELRDNFQGLDTKSFAQYQTTYETQPHYCENLLVHIHSINIRGYRDCEACIFVDIIKGKELDEYDERIHCSTEQAKILIDYIDKEIWIQSELVADYKERVFQRKFIKTI